MIPIPKVSGDALTLVVSGSPPSPPSTHHSSCTVHLIALLAEQLACCAATFLSDRNHCPSNGTLAKTAPPRQPPKESRNEEVLGRPANPPIPPASPAYELRGTVLGDATLARNGCYSGPQRLPDLAARARLARGRHRAGRGWRRGRDRLCPAQADGVDRAGGGGADTGEEDVRGGARWVRGGGADAGAARPAARDQQVP